ncbi:C2H2 finger domain protein (Zms1) [Aspergillus nomiae NRRL 13137]|uniref:C2H2 finger domain protein (Zms1) n=1 Tax=Aspergillus nomiae NRRL (strain ATCC 15546 / NRRL 13137 / CBS 260.88 / M93) TaxID=1509407 RepID=A0A0L1J6U7_ASPN3|nr:C2H2 finger domain protein (Zms1) [Aspergillus nomiae NRRL 13137]KNG87457.1 C2H2 finger domain protein (Zms1) [Aspergillus nomiae NRRL 13137]
MKSSASKHFCCTICQRGFTRIDHLKRHHLRLTIYGTTTRTALNEETERFPKLDKEAEGVMRANRQCTSMKLRCDGLRPCSSCQKRNLHCNNERNQVKDHEAEGSVSSKNNDQEPSSDRGSIKFLLNGGTDTFTEHWNLPPSNDRPRTLNDYQSPRSFEEADSSILDYSTKGNYLEYAPTYIESDPMALSFFHDTFLDFFNGPFGDPHRSTNDPYTTGMAYQSMAPSTQGSDLRLTGQQPAYEHEAPFATAMIQAILTKVWSLRLDAKTQEEISELLNFLLTPTRMRKYMALYFKYWQPNCPMIHVPTFDPKTVSLSLLTSVCFMGAKYTEDKRELDAAQRLVDFAELFVFSSGIFSSENEISSTYYGVQNADVDPNCWVQFQNLQAAFLMVICQYWSGSRTSRNRAMENRFSEVIKVARRMGLPAFQHGPEERLHEYLWIQRECRIRAINLISLLDCAFSFYSNYPCRLSHNEMECALPCVESVFESAHPFQEPNFELSRDITLSEAFQMLFEEEESSRASSPSTSGSTVAETLAKLTILDTFMLIHLLYAFINTHMTLLATTVPKTRVPHSQQIHGSRAHNYRSAIPEDSTLASIRIALSRWHDHWTRLRSATSSHDWASMGFYKNGYHFWLVSQLLITKKESVDVVMRMEVKCEDKLEQLKVLLKDDNE